MVSSRHFVIPINLSQESITVKVVLSFGITNHAK